MSKFIEILAESYTVDYIWQDDTWMDYVGGKDLLEKCCCINFEGEVIIKPTWYDSFKIWLSDLEYIMDDITYEEPYDYNKIKKQLDDYASNWNTNAEMVLKIAAAYDYNAYEDVFKHFNIEVPRDFGIDYLDDVDIEAVFYLYGLINGLKTDVLKETSMYGNEYVEINYIINDNIDPHIIADFIFGQVYAIEVIEMSDDKYTEILNSDDRYTDVLSAINDEEATSIYFDIKAISDDDYVPYDISAICNDYERSFEEI